MKRSTYKGFPNHPISDYLILSYAYYILGVNLTTDKAYDYICKYIADNWDTLTHVHKHLLTIENLEATTAYSIDAYPKVVMYIVSKLIDSSKK